MFNRTVISSLAVALLVTSACDIDVNSRDRGIQADSDRSIFDSGKTVVRGPEGQKIKLHRPGDVHLRRGGAATLTVRFDREAIHDPVEVSLSRLPDGVEAVDAPRRTDLEVVEIVLRADEDADLVENQEVRVTVAGPDSISATESFDVSVREKS